jgi:hypothetical protein
MALVVAEEGRDVTQNIEPGQVSAYLRGLADRIDQQARLIVVRSFAVDRGAEKGKPFLDGEGQWWQTWELDGQRRVRIDLEIQRAEGER